METKKGYVQGRSITLLGGEFHLDPVDVFLGIPYALPPVGPRRYSPSKSFNILVSNICIHLNRSDSHHSFEVVNLNEKTWN